MDPSTHPPANTHLAPVTGGGAGGSSDKPAKSYACGRCGQLKRGHICPKLAPPKRARGDGSFSPHDGSDDEGGPGSVEAVDPKARKRPRHPVEALLAQAEAVSAAARSLIFASIQSQQPVLEFSIRKNAQGRYELIQKF